MNEAMRQTLQECWAAALVTAKHLRKLLQLEYQAIEGQDTEEARELHAASVFADLAVTALKAANGDEKAAEQLRVPAGGLAGPAALGFERRRGREASRT
jgi:hypothetical protein